MIFQSTAYQIALLCILILHIRQGKLKLKMNMNI